MTLGELGHLLPADEEHLQALALELGLEPVKAKSCRRPKLPSLCLKYDADARILSLATHWVDLPFEQLQSLVKSSAVGSRRTPPASPSGNKHQPPWSFQYNCSVWPQYFHLYSYHHCLMLFTDIILGVLLLLLALHGE